MPAFGRLWLSNVSGVSPIKAVLLGLRKDFGADCADKLPNRTVILRMFGLNSAPGCKAV